MKNIDYTLFTASKENLRTSVPVIGLRLLGALTNFLAMYLISLLGSKAVAAGALISSVIMTVSMLAISLVIPTGIFVGHAYGAKAYKEIGSRMRAAIFLGLCVGIPATILLWYMAPILIFFGQDKHLVAIAEQYFRAYSWGMIPSIWIVSLSQFTIGISKSRMAIFWNLLSIPLMFIPGYLLLFGKWGLPNLGITGVGYAFAAMNWLMMIIVAIHLVTKNHHKKFDLFKRKNFFNALHLKELFSFGASTSIQYGAELLTLLISTLMIGTFGDTALAARQITLQIAALLLMVPYGLNIGNTILISQIRGSALDSQHKTLSIKNSAYSAFILCSIFGLVVGVIYLIIPHYIIGLYINLASNENILIVKTATNFLAITAALQFFDNLRIVATGSLRGIRDIKTPMFISVFIGCFTSLPLAYLFAYILKLGPYGILLSFVITCFLGAILLIKRFQEHITLKKCF